jgi:RecA/RadA recombinase
MDHYGSPERGRQRIQQIAEGISKKFGQHTAVPLARAGYARIKKLPFGIFELDYRTQGGIPLGKFSRLWGARSALKSTTCLHLIRQAQNTCRHCKSTIVIDPDTGIRDCQCPNPRYSLSNAEHFAFLSLEQSIKITEGLLPDGKESLAALDANGKKVTINFVEIDRCEPMRTILVDTEQTTDEKWVRANGVDPDLVMAIGSKWAEQTLDVLEDAILTNEVDLIVLDSVSMLTPADTIVKSMSEAPKMAAKATLMTRAFNKWISGMTSGGLMNTHVPTMLLVHQVRNTGIGKPWASRRPSASEAEEHALCLDIKLEAKGYAHDANGVARYGNFAFKIVKNKVGGSPEATGEFRFWLNMDGGRPVGDTDDITTVMTYAIEKEVGIVETGNKFSITSDHLSDKSLTFKTLKSLKEFFTKNTTVYADVRNRVLKYMIEQGVHVNKKVDADIPAGETVEAEESDDEEKEEVVVKYPKKQRPGKKKKK